MSCSENFKIYQNIEKAPFQITFRWALICQLTLFTTGFGNLIQIYF